MMKSILEVWDYRLSTAQPMNFMGLPEQSVFEGAEYDKARANWCGVIFSQGEDGTPLAFFDSGVAVEKGDTDDDMPDSIYEFYRSVRDEYSLPDIEKLKPKVAVIREADKLRQKATEAYHNVMTGE